MQGRSFFFVSGDYTSENSLNTMNLVEEWAQTGTRKWGLVVIGIHSPEFSFARNPKICRRLIAASGFHFPIATDNTRLMPRRVQSAGIADPLPP